MRRSSPLAVLFVLALGAGPVAGCGPESRTLEDGGGEDLDASTIERDAGGESEACETPGAIENVACGMCGTVERFCTAAGTWAYGTCEEAGECAPGTTREQSCGSCGAQAQRCTAACVWEDVGECTGGGVCEPGDRSRSASGCPAGQNRDVVCSAACAYEPAGECEADGCPTPGQIEEVACGACGRRSRFCTSAGVWEYGVCMGEGGCSPGATRSAACGACGTRDEVCDASCAWVPFGTCEASPDCCIPATEQVDLLLMVDNSNSMTEEQASLVAELPRLVRALTTGDLDGDGTPESTPVGSLHAGVVTSDMGVGGASVPTCGGGTFGFAHGDDGVLLTRGNTRIPGCNATYPAVFTFASGGDPDTFAASLSCVASVGTGGCGFEQQLEATLKALDPGMPTTWTAPGYTAPAFFGGTSGHALGANAGFVRPDSLLVAVLVTDEEDCSAADPGVFDPSSTTYGGVDLNLRCFRFPGALHPVSRYVDGLLQLRSDPTRLVVASIVGVPLAVEPTTAVPSYDTILAHPDMVERTDSTMTTRLVPSCSADGRGVAFPPRRMLTAQRDLEARGAATTTGSICQSSFTGVTRRILARIGERLAGTCD